MTDEEWKSLHFDQLEIVLLIFFLDIYVTVMFKLNMFWVGNKLILKNKSLLF